MAQWLILGDAYSFLPAVLDNLTVAMRVFGWLHPALDGRCCESTPRNTARDLSPVYLLFIEYTGRNPKELLLAKEIFSRYRWQGGVFQHH